MNGNYVESCREMAGRCTEALLVLQQPASILYSYLTAAAMLPIGFIGSGLTPGKIPRLRMRAPFCITPGGTEKQNKKTPEN